MKYLLFLYMVPVLRLLLFFAKDKVSPLFFVNRVFGFLELSLGFVRDLLVFAFVLYFWAPQIIWQIENKIFIQWEEQGIYILLVALIVFSRFWRWRSLKPFADFIHKNPTIHPQEAFNHIYASLGCLPHIFP